MWSVITIADIEKAKYNGKVLSWEKGKKYSHAEFNQAIYYWYVGFEPQ